MPALVGLSSLVGLVAALIWEGPREGFAIAAVALPLLVLAWAIWRRRG